MYFVLCLAKVNGLICVSLPVSKTNLCWTFTYGNLQFHTILINATPSIARYHLMLSAICANFRYLWEIQNLINTVKVTDEVKGNKRNCKTWTTLVP